MFGEIAGLTSSAGVLTSGSSSGAPGTDGEFGAERPTGWFNRNRTMSLSVVGDTWFAIEDTAPIRSHESGIVDIRTAGEAFDDAGSVGSLCEEIARTLSRR